MTTVIAYSFASGSILGSPRLATGLPGGLGPGPCTYATKGRSERIAVSWFVYGVGRADTGSSQREDILALIGKK